MYQVHGWWFPDEDTHFAEMLGKSVGKGGAPVYQKPVRDKSTSFVKNKQVALDIGANVGLWSRDLCEQFAQVIAFEPVSQFRDCLIKNVPAANLDVRPCALGKHDTMIDMIITKENTGHSHVDQESMGQGKTPMHRLDSLEFDRIDYIKIDCEGYEITILEGGRETIQKHRPVVVVEQKLHLDAGITADTQFGAVDLLKSWGAQELGRVKHDVILGWAH